MTGSINGNYEKVRASLVLDGTLAIDNFEKLVLLANDNARCLVASLVEVVVAFEFRAVLVVREEVDLNTVRLDLLANTVALPHALLALHVAVTPLAHGLVHRLSYAHILERILAMTMTLVDVYLLLLADVGLLDHLVTLLVRNLLSHKVAVLLARSVAFLEGAIDGLVHLLRYVSAWSVLVTASLNF